MSEYRRYFVPGGTYFYNPVKHRLASCPHAWPASSFSRWVALGLYDRSWGCCCHAGRPALRDFRDIEDLVGEPSP